MISLLKDPQNVVEEERDYILEVIDKIYLKGKNKKTNLDNAELEPGEGGSAFHIIEKHY